MTEHVTNKLPQPEISADFPFKSRFIEVLSSRMHYVDIGEGDPILFIHGNPTSSYLWRNVIPLVENSGRVIALDLIGMGQSDKPDLSYSFADHFSYVEAFIAQLGLENVTLILHDWGTTLGFEYARQHEGNVRRIAFMEGAVPPALPMPSFDVMGQEGAEVFNGFKTPGQGETMILDNNMFIEQVLPGSINRTLTEEEMNAYRAPYISREARKPLLAWPREIPVAGKPEGMVEAMSKISTFIDETSIPFLLLYGSPGIMCPPELVPVIVEKYNNIETHYVGQGLHYLQEDHPNAIGLAISDWIRRTAN